MGAWLRKSLTPNSRKFHGFFFFFACLSQYTLWEGSRFLAPALGWKGKHGTCLQCADLSGTCQGLLSLTQWWWECWHGLDTMWVVVESRGRCCCQRQLLRVCRPAGDWGQDYGQRDTTLYLNPWEVGVRRLVCRECGVKADTHRPREDTPARKYLNEPWTFIPGWLMKAFPWTGAVCKEQERWVSFQMPRSNKRWQDIQRNRETGPVQRNRVNQETDRSQKNFFKYAQSAEGEERWQTTKWNQENNMRKMRPLTKWKL